MLFTVELSRPEVLALRDAIETVIAFKEELLKDNDTDDAEAFENNLAHLRDVYGKLATLPV